MAKRRTMEPTDEPITLRMPISLRRYSVSNIVSENTPITVMMMQMMAKNFTCDMKRNSST